MNLSALFSPRAIAVIGASTTVGSVGHSLTENLFRYSYKGTVYPINPKADTLFDRPCFKKIADVPQDIDLAIIIIPAMAVPQALREVGEKNVPAAIIISSGFKETGERGAALETEIQAIAEEFHIALLGPNCLGFLHPALGLNASFAKGLPKVGPIAFFSQSGALCTALLDVSADTLGFSAFVSDGNKAVLGENELLKHFAADEETDVISFYTESMTDAKALIATGRAILARPTPKPIIALKSGTTTAGTSASSSHTGALAGSDAAYQALFEQARIVRADSLQSLSDLLTVFSQNPLPQGKRIGIITNAGGLGVLATDAASTHGLTLATLSPETIKKLSALPAAAARHNPVDVLGDAPADRYRLALDAVAADSQVDMLLVIVTPQTVTQAKETAEAIADIKNHSGKPVVAIFAGDQAFTESWPILKKNHVATLRYPENGAQALAALATVASWRESTQATAFTFPDIDSAAARQILEDIKTKKRTTLYETEVWDILAAYGFTFPKRAVVHSRAEAEAAAVQFTNTLALKIISPDITHKSDAGGVILSVSPADVGAQYDTLMAQVKTHSPEATLEGALLVEMAETGGREIILGMKEEPGLGKLLMVGLGGIFVETFKDVAFRFAPLTEEDVDEMIHELKSLPLLEGARGQDGIDLQALKMAIGRLSQLVQDFPEIDELDINPLLCFKDASHFRVLDARITLKAE
jgi:acetyltransferase